MTAIVGIAREGRTWIGADSCVTDAGTRTAALTPKLWRSGGYLIGAAGNGAWYTIMRRLRWPAVASTGYMTAAVIADILNAAHELGLELPAAEESPADGAALIGGCGRLWYVDSDLTAIEYSEVATGSGGEGAMCALKANAVGSPRTRILRALGAVSAVRNDVGPPFLVDSI